MGRPKGSKNKPKQVSEEALYKGITVRRISADVFDVSDVNHPKVVTKRAIATVAQPQPSAYLPHGDVKHRAVIEPCPVCLYAYADGGYCFECGWTLPIKLHPWGTLTGRKWK